MNRRGFLRLLAGGIAAFKAVGLPLPSLQTIFGNGFDGDVTLTANTEIADWAQRKKYATLVIPGFKVTSHPDEYLLVKDVVELRRNG
jgi:hypothetical protein